MLAHWVRRFAYDSGIGLDIQRVSSDDNVADEPSRECYSLLDQIGAERVRPVLPETARKPRDKECLEPCPRTNKRCRVATSQGNACLECGSPTGTTSKLVFSFSQSGNPVVICEKCVPLSETVALIAIEI